jgi:hypothetical protein
MRAKRDDRLAARALRECWHVPAYRLPALVKVLVDIALNPKASHRNRTSAVKALQGVGKANLDAIRTAVSAQEHDELVARLKKVEAHIEEFERMADRP